VSVCVHPALLVPHFPCSHSRPRRAPKFWGLSGFFPPSSCSKQKVAQCHMTENVCEKSWLSAPLFAPQVISEIVSTPPRRLRTSFALRPSWQPPFATVTGFPAQGQDPTFLCSRRRSWPSCLDRRHTVVMSWQDNLTCFCSLSPPFFRHARGLIDGKRAAGHPEIPVLPRHMLSASGTSSCPRYPLRASPKWCAFSIAHDAARPPPSMRSR